MGDPRPAAPHQLVAVGNRDTVLNIRIVGVDEEPWRIGRLAAVNTAVKSLNLQAMTVAGVAVPARHEIASGDMFVATARLVDRASEYSSLSRYGFTRTRRPIEPETRAQPLPCLF